MNPREVRVTLAASVASHSPQQCICSYVHVVQLNTAIEPECTTSAGLTIKQNKYVLMTSREWEGTTEMIASCLTVQEQTKIAARYEVWNSVVLVQRWWHAWKGKHATLRLETIKSCHAKLMTMSSVNNARSG
eukprot:XP_014779650.1 PREDICTED: uncharacterized protein LOC106875864 [Octopus bimaculoides]